MQYRRSDRQPDRLRGDHKVPTFSKTVSVGDYSVNTNIAAADIALKSRDDPSLRDQHIAQIQTYGRLAWQVRSGYNQRSRAEAQIGRWKSVIGPKLRSRRFENQKTEAQIGVRALNRMTELGCARFESVG